MQAVVVAVLMEAPFLMVQAVLAAAVEVVIQRHQRWREQQIQVAVEAGVALRLEYQLLVDQV